MTESPTALLIMSSQERRLPLLKELKSLEIETLIVANCREARSLLETKPPLDVVITEVSLSDGNWCDVLTYVVDHGIGASVVVSSPPANEMLWSEVLWRGVYDMLIEPYERNEIRRVMEGALRAAHTSRLCYAEEWVGSVA